MVALPPCFFCKINSASRRVRWPHFMNDGNLLRPSIYLNPRHHYATPPCFPPTLLQGPPAPGGRDSAIFLVWRKIHYHQPPWLSPAFAQHTGTHIHCAHSCTRKRVNDCVFWYVRLHTHTHTHVSNFFQPSNALHKLSSLVQVI